MPDLKRLRRSNRNKMIAGVCAGLPSWLGWDVTLVRVFFVVGSFVPVIPGFLVYIVLWIVVPAER